MDVIDEFLNGAKLLKIERHSDIRGDFAEIFHQEKYERAGIALPFVQDNISRSFDNVLRGLHLQRQKPQGKLVVCLSGQIQDVIVDARIDSPSFGGHKSLILSESNSTQLWVPPGFAHGFLTLKGSATVLYKCTDLYDPTDESGIAWNDPTLDIKWQCKNPKVSYKDSKLPRFGDQG